MCGIAGCVADNPAAVQEMTTLLAHRGPDDRGLVTLHGVTLGHTRLSIIDVAGGHQPLGNEDGSIQVVLNGELYNFSELQADLRQRGHSFKTRTDTEVLVHLYEEFGSAMVEKLYGMFAFALVAADGLLLARDPLGIKPLYYGYDANGRIWFASELRALLDHVETPKEFPNGYYYHSKTGFQAYYRMPPITEDLTDLEEAEAEVLNRLREAVRRRLLGDVPVGTFLSGGLDSSLIAALAVELRQGDALHSFAVGMEGSDDIVRAREMARHIGTRHHEFLFNENDLIEALPSVIAALESFDAALVRSAIPTHFVARLAREHVKVVLSGEGADELFGGYQYLRNPAVLPKLQEELQRITRDLHHTNLQRVDRMTMWHGLEARVPFLSVDLQDIAWRIPAKWKIHEESNSEKWLLRRVSRSYLPESVSEREKAKFAIGTGVGPTLELHAEKTISDDEFARAAAELPEGLLRSKEELMYYRLFAKTFGDHARSLLPLVGRSRSLNPDDMFESPVLPATETS